MFSHWLLNCTSNLWPTKAASSKTRPGTCQTIDTQHLQVAACWGLLLICILIMLLLLLLLLLRWLLLLILLSLLLLRWLLLLIRLSLLLLLLLLRLLLHVVMQHGRVHLHGGSRPHDVHAAGSPCCHWLLPVWQAACGWQPPLHVWCLGPVFRTGMQCQE